MDDLSQFESVTSDSGFAVLEDRTLIKLTGGDRAKFLHSFCTADVVGMTSGESKEAFVLNGKGKVLGHVQLITTNDSLLISGATRQAATLIEHLDKYVIREDVEFQDLSDDFVNIFVFGEAAPEKLERQFDALPGPGKSIEINDQNIVLSNAELAGDGWLILTNRSLSEIEPKLIDAGLHACSSKLFHAVRIANQTPWFGNDISIENLPQELRRDAKSISFNKGCYLGQETVARIDALGQVNRLLVGLETDAGANLAPGTEFLIDGKSIGRVTSFSDLAIPDRPNALAVVRRAHANPGTLLMSDRGNATVV